MTAVRLREWRGVKSAAGPSGTAVTARLRVTPADEAVLDAVAVHLVASGVLTWLPCHVRSMRPWAWKLRDSGRLVGMG